MNKKIFTVVFLMILIQFGVYAASSEITVAIPPKDSLTDNQYIITVDIGENTGFVSAQLELEYNKDVIECEKIIVGDVLKGMITDTNPTAKGEKTSAILSAAGTENVTKTGNIVTFVFGKPKDGDPEFKFVQFELINASGEKLDCSIHIQNDYGDISADDEKPASPKPSKPSGGGSGSSGSSGRMEKNTPTPTLTPTPTPTITPNTSNGQITVRDNADKIDKAAKTFTDLDENHWAKEYIDKAVNMGFVSGYDDGTFLPDKEMTRAEFATVIWNISGKPVKGGVLTFEDVSEKNWFYEPVLWAYANGYISGISSEQFAPNENITREAAMTILYRYKGSPKTNTVIDSFEDCGNVSDYAANAMNWAVSEKIISGTSDTQLAPNSNATRAQLAAIMVRMLNNNK